MRRFAVLVVVLLLGVAAEASAACPAPARVVEDRAGKRVVVCEDGRQRTIRRGGRYVEALRTSTRLALTTVARGRQAVELRTWPGDRLIFRRERAIARRLDRPGLALDAAGRMAWSFNGRLRVRLASGRVLDVARNGESPFLAGGTLVWGGFLDVEFRDLVRFAPRPGGCPQRPGMKVLGGNDRFEVTETAYEDRGRTITAVRVCARGSDGDFVVVTGGSFDSDSVRLGLGGLTDRYAVATSSWSSKYGCEVTAVFTTDVASGRRTSWGEIGGSSGPDGTCVTDAYVPRPGDPLVVTAGGAPAWIRDGVVRAVRRDHQIAELDRGAVIDLTVDGATVRWRRDGTERSATP